MVETAFNGYLFNDFAVRAIEEHNLSRPLFMYLAWQNPHMPQEVPAMYLNPAIGDCKRRTIEAMIYMMDEGQANVTAAIDTTDLSSSTEAELVVTNERGRWTSQTITCHA